VCPRSPGGGRTRSPLLVHPRVKSAEEIVVHAWDVVIAEELLPLLGRAIRGLVIQCGLKDLDRLRRSAIVPAANRQSGVCFVTCEAAMVDELTSLGLADDWVRLIPFAAAPAALIGGWRRELRRRWRLSEQDWVLSVLPSPVTGAVYDVVWAAYLAHEAVADLRLVLAGVGRDQRRSERMAAGCGKEHLSRFLDSVSWAGELAAVADCVIAPVGISESAEDMQIALSLGVPVLSVERAMSENTEKRPDDVHRHHDLAAELLAWADRRGGETTNDQAAMETAWSLQIGAYRQLYESLGRLSRA
jgi:hypothetical protein